MSNDNVYESLFKVQASINKMVVDGKRKPVDVLRYLQCIVDDKDFVWMLDVPKPIIKLISADGRVVEWQRFYKEVFDLEVDFAGVEIAREQPGFGWVVMVARGLTLSQVWAKCREHFCVYSYVGNLEKAIVTNDRTSATVYVKRFRGRVEADKENKCLSANALADRKAQSITLLERLLLELWYHWKTGEHLDIKNITLCAGSRDYHDIVPSVYWRNDKLYVNYCRLGFASDTIRARSAI
jgi:hypothetical protein